MATITDSIVGMLILIIAIVAIGVVVTGSITKNSVRDVEQDRNVLFEERTDTAIDAVFASTEDQTGMSISELIGESMFTLRTDVQIGNITVPIVEETRERLDTVFGQGNYYVTLKPIIKGVNLMFVLDSSESVTVERDTIADNLAFIQTTIEERIQVIGDEKVTTQILILPTTQDTPCPTFDDLQLPDTTCEQLTDISLYAPLLEKGWERPGFGAGTYNDWASTTHYAGIESFALSDWGAGTATAALRYQSDAYLQNTVNLNLIFPLSDELSTTSKAKTCFNKFTDEEWFICQMCDGTCPTARSLQSISQAINITQQTKSLVFPIYSFNCDYNYVPEWNRISLSSNTYIHSFNDQGSIPLDDFPAESWCSQNACPGCTEIGNDFCFHDNCQPILQNHMELIANATNGSVFNVNDASEIPDNILTAFDRATASYNFEIGYEDEQRDRFVYEKIVPLPNGAFGRVSLWVYTESPRICFDDEPCETREGCEGTRACIDSQLSEECVKNDPDCLGKPCTGPELCVDDELCVGTKACIDGLLSEFCIKSNPDCAAPCIDNCYYAGEAKCEEVEPGSGSYAISACLRAENGCLQWLPVRQCQEPCQNQVACGEDPSCPYDCATDDVCNQNCSQSALCWHDEDCPFDCHSDCRDNGYCNIYCSSLQAGCPLDPDCPYCMQGGDDPQSCPDQGPTCCIDGDSFVWAQREYAPSGLGSCYYSTCFSASCGDALPFGMCCPNPTDCVVLTNPRMPECVPEGHITNNYVFSGTGLCINQVITNCAGGQSCVDDPSRPYCTPTPVTVGGQTFICNYETSEWEVQP